MHIGRLLPLLCSLYFFTSPAAQAQSLRKMEHQAINRTHLTFVNGDTVQRFTITRAHPTPRASRFYYWQGPTQILRTAGAYDGHLLSGAYQLTSRNGNLLGSGTFKKGLKTGLWRTWRADGTPLTSSHWHQGRRRGKIHTYDKSGHLLKPTGASKQKTKVVATQPQDSVHIWQPVYWKGKLKRLKIRHRDKAAPLPLSVPAPPRAEPPAPRPAPTAPLLNQPGS